MGRKNGKSPIRKKSGDQSNELSTSPKLWWQSALEANKIIAAGTVAAAIIAIFAYVDVHQANLATWEQGRAHLEIADTPVSTISVDTDYTPNKNGQPRHEGVIMGKLYISNRGPSEAIRPTISIGVAVEPFGICPIWANQGYGYEAQAAKLAPKEPPIAVDYNARFAELPWIYLAVDGGEIHVVAQMTFDDVYGNKSIVQTVEGVTPAGGFVSSTMQLQPREFLPLYGRNNCKQLTSPQNPINIGIPP